MKGKKKADEKQKVSKTKSSENAADDDSDGDSYEDPSHTFATEPPIPSMPNYPPPRLNSMNAIIQKVNTINFHWSHSYFIIYYITVFWCAPVYVTFFPVGYTIV